MVMIGFETAALGAATLWALGGLIAASPTKELGGPRFTRLRMYSVAVILAAIASVVGGWSTLDLHGIVLLGLSGIVGLALGDAAIFTSFARLGPRRTGILFAMNAPMAALLSALFFEERFSAPSLAGSMLVVAGVVLAIAFGTRVGQQHHWEEIRGSLAVGVGFGLLGALGQAVGVLLADPVFENAEVDVWAGAAVRAIVGLAALVFLRGWFERRAQVPHPGRLRWQLWAILIVSGLVAMVFGKTLLLVALQTGDPGIVSVLVSTSPVIQLPLIWALTRERPAGGAWLGAGLASVGTALIVF